MNQGPFGQVRRITRALFADDCLLPGLIAVLSQASTSALLLAYVGQVPSVLPPGMRAISADQLAVEDLTGFDGPTVGLAAIDHIRPDIGTKGPYFVRLDRLLRLRDREGLLRSTWTALADYLAARLGSIQDERTRRIAAAEIAAIKAPALIRELPAARRRGLVAFLPSTSETVCLDNLALDGIALGDLAPLRICQDEITIAFEEIWPLIEVSSGTRSRHPYPIELRDVLRRGAVDEDLDETLRQLSRAFLTRWQAEGDPADRERAYAIALEGRLAHRDADDLIAVVPSPNFERFLTEGAGLYVYRRPLEGVSGTDGSAISSKYLNDAIGELSEPASPVVFSLLPLKDLGGAMVRWCDLGPPLRKSGRTEILARNAWLLVEDLIDEREQGRSRPGITAESLYATMVRCCVIFSLTDPWRTREGRRDEWVQAAYRTLIRVIRIRRDEQSSAADRGYFEALEQWYSCALATEDEEVEVALGEVVARLALATSRAAPFEQPRYEQPRYEQPHFAQDAGKLMNVAVPLRQLLGGGARAEAYDLLKSPPVQSIPQVVRHATDMAEPISLLSVPFGSSFREYAALQERIRRLNIMAMRVRDKTDGLEQLAVRLGQCRRLIFAPAHEARILHALFSDALKAIMQSISELRGGATVELRLRTASVELGEDSPLLFSVRNGGSLPARDVELELGAAESFDLLDKTFKQSLPQLAPNEERAFRFLIRCATEAPDFPIRCVVSWCHGKAEPDGQGDAAERQQVTQGFVLQTVGAAPSQPFRKKPNPYVFGVHVKDHQSFFGRRGELDELLGHLAHGGPQNVLLRAPRRAGKTSLLHMVKAVLEDTDRRAGVRDWFEVPAGWDANLNATIPVFLNLQGIEDLQKNATATAFYRAVLGGLRDAGLQGSFCDLLLRGPVITYTQFSRGLREMVTAAGGRRPVMLLDEFDVLDSLADKGAFYSALRTVVADVQGVNWIAVSALGLYKEVRDYASPLFNIFKIVTMGRMDEEAARRLVTSPWEPGGSLADASLSIHPDAVYAILEEAGNYPYFIQMLCSEVVDYVNAVQSNHVRLSTVQKVVDRQMVTEGGAADLTFDYMWQGASPTGRLLMLTLLHRDLAMAYEELKAGARRLLEVHERADLIGPLLAEFDESLTRLTYMDAVRHVPGAGYAFGVPIFRSLLVRKADRMNLEAATIEELAASVAAAVQ
ncbi:MAG TPA: ATP-binding protein [Streptosporangiaceae bacterium]|nr:ATP-binding protein [Streptosporangiaceae bacterium]